MNIGLICGYEIDQLNNDAERLIIETEYGNVSLKIKNLNNNQIYIINRHGENQNIPPHKINYRANIKAFNSCKINNIISIGTVGSLKTSIKIGDILIPNDFVDFTKSRYYTYYDNKRLHVDMNYPICPSIRELLNQSCKNISDITYHEKGVYLTTEGPRLETASEIKLFSNFADVVGMTFGQEIIFARELGLCYGAICIICNLGSGLQKNLHAVEMSKVFNKKKGLVFKIIKNAFENIKYKKKCNCKDKYLLAEI
jgi:5'-methylthioadenosine phosphorylase